MKKYLAFAIFLFALNLHSQLGSLEINLYADGFDRPLYVTNDAIFNNNEFRLYVVEQGGKIKVLSNGMTIPTPFLNISGQVSNGNEQGLLGLAFHPDYENNGYFYINYTKPNGDTQISRFSVDPTNPNRADPNSELPIIGYAQPFANHNGGHLAFGPDGYLYISSGDGGGSGDPNDNAQNINVLLGKLLRIDVDNPSGGNNYGIPADNPFVGIPNAREEIWAYGLRNPWRFSFDFQDNNLWIGDVGQSAIEEINKAGVAEAGLNYGWRCYEGSQPYNTQNCPPQSEFTFPFAEYPHDNGNCSITGGYVYRGNSYGLVFRGSYFYADYCSGEITVIDKYGELLDEAYYPGKRWVSFGEDMGKELYVIDIAGGGIYSLYSILATEGNSLESSLSMFPNPSSGQVIFRSKDDLLTNIDIFDIRGRLVYSAEKIFSDQKTISVSNLKAGIYLVGITSKKGNSPVKKLIVQ